jgi:electron transport complex protein RnfG
MSTESGPAPTGGTVPAVPAPVEVKSWRLVTTLAVAGSMAGLLIVLVFQWAHPRILDHQERALTAAVDVVLSGPERTERFFVVEGELLTEAPAGSDTLKLERVFLGFDATGAPIGYAVRGGEAGFQDIITVLFGYHPGREEVLGMLVLDNKETPGLGDKIVKDMAFVGAFAGVRTPIVAVKADAGSGAETEVDMITGATISSRAVIDIINHRVAALGPILQRHLQTRPQ